jgi:ketosteroid isomerase-like protein
MTAAVVLAGRFWAYVDDGKWDEARALLADDFRADWPQTEEEVLSADRYIEVNRELLSGAKCILLEASGADDWAATRVLIDKGERMLWAVSFWTARDGKLVEATEYFPTPKEPKHETH